MNLAKTKRKVLVGGEQHTMYVGTRGGQYIKTKNNTFKRVKKQVAGTQGPMPYFYNSLPYVALEKEENTSWIDTIQYYQTKLKSQWKGNSGVYDLNMVYAYERVDACFTALVKRVIPTYDAKNNGNILYSNATLEKKLFSFTFPFCFINSSYLCFLCEGKNLSLEQWPIVNTPTENYKFENQLTNIRLSQTDYVCYDYIDKREQNKLIFKIKSPRWRDLLIMLYNNFEDVLIFIKYKTHSWLAHERFTDSYIQSMMYQYASYLNTMMQQQFTNGIPDIRIELVFRNATLFEKLKFNPKKALKWLAIPQIISSMQTTPVNNDLFNKAIEKQQNMQKQNNVTKRPTGALEPLPINSPLNNVKKRNPKVYLPPISNKCSPLLKSRSPSCPYTPSPQNITTSTYP